MTVTADAELDRHGLLVPLAISFFVHALFVLFMLRAAFSAAPEAPPLDVEILTPEQAQRYAQAKPKPASPPAPAVPQPQVEKPPLPKSQMVAPPDSPEAEPPPDTRFLSDKNSRTDREMVKKGEPAPPAKPPDQLAKADAKREPLKPAKPLAKSEPEKREAKPVDGRRGESGEAAKRVDPTLRSAPLPGLGDLFVRPSELVKDPTLSKGSDGKPSQSDDERNYASIGRPELWANPGERGTPDYLPDVRNGSFTLLNTKADRFAPFVRRVGLRVFQSFSMDFKNQIFNGGVPQGQENVEVEAVMSADGKRLDVYLKQRLGNLSTDRVLLGSLRDQIFFDENPPAKAVAEDGKIHFVFALDARVWYSRDEAGQMSPGAQWIFGAGLL